MRKYGLFLITAALIATPAAAQTLGGANNIGINTGSPASSAGYSATAYGGTAAIGMSASQRSFFNADGSTQLAAHKARWARIEAKRAQRALEKARKQSED